MTSIDRFKFSFRNAISGIRIAYKSQKNLRIHITIGIVVLVLAAILKVSATELTVLLVTIVTVVIAEVFNTALEFSVDLISPEYNKLAKKAKDVSAAGVLITASFALMIGLIIFLPKIIRLVREILQIIL